MPGGFILFFWSFSFLEYIIEGKKSKNSDTYWWSWDVHAIIENIGNALCWIDWRYNRSRAHAIILILFSYGLLSTHLTFYFCTYVWLDWFMEDLFPIVFAYHQNGNYVHIYAIFLLMNYWYFFMHTQTHTQKELLIMLLIILPYLRSMDLWFVLKGMHLLNVFCEYFEVIGITQAHQNYLKFLLHVLFNFDTSLLKWMLYEQVKSSLTMNR